MRSKLDLRRAAPSVSRNRLTGFRDSDDFERRFQIIPNFQKGFADKRKVAPSMRQVSGAHWQPAVELRMRWRPDNVSRRFRRTEKERL